MTCHAMPGHHAGPCHECACMRVASRQQATPTLGSHACPAGMAQSMLVSQTPTRRPSSHAAHRNHKAPVGHRPLRQAGDRQRHSEGDTVRGCAMRAHAEAGPPCRHADERRQEGGSHFPAGPHPKVRGLGAGGAVPQRREARPQRDALLGCRHAAADCCCRASGRQPAGGGGGRAGGKQTRGGQPLCSRSRASAGSRAPCRRCSRAGSALSAEGRRSRTAGQSRAAAPLPAASHRFTDVSGAGTGGERLVGERQVSRRGVGTLPARSEPSQR